MHIDQLLMPDIRVAAIRRVGPYGPQIGESFTKIFNWACRQNLCNGSTLGIGAYYDCPSNTEPAKCRMDACITLPEGVNPVLEDGIEIRTLAGGICATCLCNVYNNDFCASWDSFSGLLIQRGAQLDLEKRPCLEIYYGPCADSSIFKKWVVDLVKPLKEYMD